MHVMMVGRKEGRMGGREAGMQGGRDGGMKGGREEGRKGSFCVRGSRYALEWERCRKTTRTANAIVLLQLVQQSRIYEYVCHSEHQRYLHNYERGTSWHGSH